MLFGVNVSYAGGSALDSLKASLSPSVLSGIVLPEITKGLAAGHAPAAAGTSASANAAGKAVMPSARISYWDTGNEAGSSFYWRTGQGPGSDFYWRTGQGSGSSFYWRTGQGPGSSFYWRTGNGPGSSLFWNTGMGPGSKNYHPIWDGPYCIPEFPDPLNSIPISVFIS